MMPPLTLSCLLEAGRYDDLLALLAVKKTRLWFDEKFAAEALRRQGREDEALARAEALLEGDRQPWGHGDIARFCEGILVRHGKADAAYRRFGLPSAAGNTWLAMWRDLVKRYPERDGRAVLEDLIALHGRKGKWFAAAKTAGYLDIALRNQWAVALHRKEVSFLRDENDILRRAAMAFARTAYPSAE